ncbi:MAG: hypothetical protein J5524_10735 [Bacteroidaceae bacterium]|nr:hypothetical protein [Bacteroidaceae bacterium]
MKDLAGLLFLVGCGVVLPIFGIWWGVRQKMNETNKHAEVLLAAIEKNPDMDLEDVMRKLTPKKKSLKEELLSKLLRGCITFFIGICLLGYAFWIDCMGGSSIPFLQGAYLGGFIMIGVGIAFLINYCVGKKMLAKEIEAEEQKLND